MGFQVVTPGQTEAQRSECKNRIGFHEETILAGLRTHAKAHWIETLANRWEDQIAEGLNPPALELGSGLGEVVTLPRGVASVLMAVLRGAAVVGVFAMAPWWECKEADL